MFLSILVSDAAPRVKMLYTAMLFTMLTIGIAVIGYTLPVEVMWPQLGIAFGISVVSLVVLTSTTDFNLGFPAFFGGFLDGTLLSAFLGFYIFTVITVMGVGMLGWRFISLFL